MDEGSWETISFYSFTVINVVYATETGTTLTIYLPTKFSLNSFPVTWGWDKGKLPPLGKYCSAASATSPHIMTDEEVWWEAQVLLRLVNVGCQSLLNLADCGKIRDTQLWPALWTETIPKRHSWGGPTQKCQIWHSLQKPRQHPHLQWFHTKS